MAPDGQIAIEKETAAAPERALSRVSARAAGSALRWAALICILAATLLWMGPYIWRADLVSEDAAQHIFWLWRFVDPGLLLNDPATDYFASLAVAPAGYQAIYAILAPAFGPQLSGELVAAALIAISGVLAWKVGTSTGGRQRRIRGLIAVAATLILIALPGDLLSPMGFQRTFALPITLLALWALIARRYEWVGASWLLAALLYPVILPVLGIAAGAVFLVDLTRDRRMPRAWIWNMAAGVASISIVLYSAVPLDWVGPQVTLDEARTMPEFGPGGRLDLESRSWGFWIRDQRYGIGWSPAILFAFAAAAWIASRLRGMRAIPLAAWSFALTGLGLWALSHLILFHLYLPNRHSRTSVAVFGVAAVAIALSILLERLGERRVRFLAWCAPAVVILAFLPPALHTWHTPVDEDLERIYARISALPPSTVVAAHPDLADFIPLRTGRAVLASSETALPFMPGYYARIKPRVKASLRAAYAPDWKSLETALQPYLVDVVLLGPPPFRRSGYLPPFDEFVRELGAGGVADERILRDLPAGQLLLRSGPYLLVQLHPPDAGVIQARVWTAGGGSARQ